jgi:hypothetical protein
MLNEDYSVPALEAFSSDSNLWSELNLTDAHENAPSPPPLQRLIDRNVNIIEGHLIDVMKWRKVLIDDCLHTMGKYHSGHRHNMSHVERTDLEGTTCSNLRREDVRNTFESKEVDEGDDVNRISLPVKCNATSETSETQSGCSLLSSDEEDKNCIPSLARSELVLFVTTIANRYNDVLYHNFEHASHVTACVHQLILMMRDGFDGPSRRSSELTSSSSLTASSSVSPVPAETASSDIFIATNPMVHLALVITALIHDVEHQGIGNKQLVDESSPLAIKYKGKSVAENNSFDVANTVLFQKQFLHLRQCMFGDVGDVANHLSLDKSAPVLKGIRKQFDSYTALFHQVSHDAIMATDISCPMRLEKGKLKWNMSIERGIPDALATSNHCGARLNKFEEEKEGEAPMRRSSFPPITTTARFPRRLSAPHHISSPTEFIADPFPDQTKLPPPERRVCSRECSLIKTTEITCPLCVSPSPKGDAFKCMSYVRMSSILEQLVQAADVGHTMQSWDVFKKWNEKLYYELWAAKVNRRGPDCLGQWFEGQISFFDKYIFPLAQRLKQCKVFGSLGLLFYDNACLNRERWIDEGQDLCRQMHENRSRLVGDIQPLSSD